MKIAIFGLGCVGSVTATMLAEQGHQVVGIDSDVTKVELIRSGGCPVVEPGLGARLRAVITSGALVAVTDSDEAIGWEVAFVCVGTPCGNDGKPDTSALENVVAQIGDHLRCRDRYSVVVLRSTTYPEVVARLLLPILGSTSRELPGARYGMVVVPEFLREGTAVADFVDPPFTFIGQTDKRAGDVIGKLFEFTKAPQLRGGFAEAMMIKYASNAYHALKIAFANEIGSICATSGIDGEEVMKAFCLDTKLNVSPLYLKPGLAFGGSCLGKDLRVLNHFAKKGCLKVPVLDAINRSNASHLARCVEKVLATERNRIGIVGVGFKAGTNDLRESPMVLITKALVREGKEVLLYDESITPSTLLGDNLEFLKRTIPNFRKLFKATVDEVLEAAEVVVVGHRQQGNSSVPWRARDDQIVVDFGQCPVSQEHLDEVMVFPKTMAG